MSDTTKKYGSLILWILGILIVGSFIGSSTRAEINTWYLTLQKSPLTPPNYVFPIVWSILYIMIASTGWILWRADSNAQIELLKKLFILQLLLNWCWTPAFFILHSTGMGLIIILALDAVVCSLIFFANRQLKKVAFLMLPYFIWLLLATHLNVYIWQYN